MLAHSVSAQIILGVTKVSWTELAAWAGLSLGVINFGWDLFKWQQKKPRLRITVQANVYFTDEMSKAAQDSTTNAVDIRPTVTILVTNVGELPTTVNMAFITNEPGKLFGLIQRKPKPGVYVMGYPALQTYDGKKLPVRMDSGDTLRFRIDQDILVKGGNWGPPYVRIEASHQSSPLCKAIGGLNG